MANLIWIGPGDGSNKTPHVEEGICNEAGILPGSVVDYAAANAGFELMDDAATVYGKPLMVADKKTYGEVTVDTAWTTTETMQAIHPRSGEYLNVRVITGQALAKGTALTRSAATPGALVIASIASPQLEEILCYSDEIKTTSGTELVRVRIK